MAKSRELIELFHEAVKTAPLGFKGVAADLDKRPSTLYDELNPAPEKSGQGKLGVEDALEIMEMTGDSRPLEYMATRLGFTLRHMADCTPDQPTLAGELLDDLPAIARLHDAARSGMPQAKVAELLRLAIAELEQDYAAYVAHTGNNKAFTSGHVKSMRKVV